MLTYVDTLLGFAVVMLGISLLITVLNQAVSALFAHRGSNLRWGLGVLFKQINPGAGLPMLTANADLLAEMVLTHPLISDSTFSTSLKRLLKRFPDALAFVHRWQLANAVEPDELAAVLSQIAGNRPPEMHAGLHAMLSAEISSLLKSPSATAIRQGELATAVAAVVPGQLVTNAVDVVETASGNLEAWFAKITDRVSQRFTTWMRIWTVIFAFTISAVFCLDAFRLLSDLYKNGDLRSQLVGAAPQVIEIAKRVIPPGSTTPTDSVNQNVTGMYTDALQKAAKDALIATAVTPMASIADVDTWIGKNVPAEKQSDVRKRFESYWESQMIHDTTQLWSILSGSKLPTFGWTGFLGSDRSSQFWTILGVLVSGLLLSLGAPFWYNALATLTSLRPVLVSKQQSQDQAKLAKQSQ